MNNNVLSCVSSFPNDDDDDDHHHDLIPILLSARKSVGTITTTTTTSSSSSSSLWNHHHHDNDSDNDNDANHALLSCAVCKIDNVGKYTCPKCGIVYCSVSCYQQHKNNNTRTSCQELFYQTRVAQVLKLEQQEDSQTRKRTRTTQQMLNRIHHQQQQQEQSLQQQEQIVEQNRNDSSTHATTTISSQQNELIELLSILEEQEEDNDSNESSFTKLQDFFQTHPHLEQSIHSTFQRMMQHQHDDNNHYDDDNDNHNYDDNDDNYNDILEWIVQPWHPWWRREFSKKKNNNNDDDDEPMEEEDTTTTTTIMTLDERILAIPPFDTIRPKNATATAAGTKNKSPVSSLQYNLVEILYSICSIFRIYHGPFNAKEHMTIEDTIENIIMTTTTTSKVLSQDARYTSLEHVLMDLCCCNNTIQPQQPQQHQQNTKWNDLLLQDVALICRNPRYVTKALLEYQDVLIHVQQQKYNNKKKKKKSKKKKSKSNSKTSATTTTTKSIRHMIQKLEYYLSWWQYHTSSVVGAINNNNNNNNNDNDNDNDITMLSHNIECWRMEWCCCCCSFKSLQTCHEKKETEHTVMLNLPEPSTFPTPIKTVIYQPHDNNHNHNNKKTDDLVGWLTEVSTTTTTTTTKERKKERKNMTDWNEPKFDQERKKSIDRQTDN